MSKKFLVDAAERIGWTAVQAAGAVVIATGDFDWLTLKAALIAGGLAAVKALVATKIGDPNSAATIR